MLRAGPQAAKLRILVDGRERLAELVARRGAARHAGGLDGLQLFGARADPADRRRRAGADADGGVPAAALARGAAAEGGAGDLRGAGAGQAAGLGGGGLRPRCATRCGSRSASVADVRHHILFDPGHGLEERLIREQFV